MKFITEVVRNIYGDDHVLADRSYISVRDDPDGLGCIEVSYHRAIGEGDRITMSPEQAIAVANAILLHAADLLKK